MKTEKYLKLIYERGSIIFRKVISYTMCEDTQLLTITYSDETKCVVDLMFLNSCLGKLINIKDNIYEIKSLTTMDITQYL